MIEDALETHEIHQPVARAAVVGGRHAVNRGEQVEAFDHRQVPPQLCALAEDHADTRDVAFPVLPRREPIDFAAAGARRQDAGEDLDGGRLAGAVGTDEAEQRPFAKFD